MNIKYLLVPCTLVLFCLQFNPCKGYYHPDGLFNPTNFPLEPFDVPNEYGSPLYSTEDIIPTPSEEELLMG